MVCSGGTKIGGVEKSEIEDVTSEGLSEAWFTIFSVVFGGSFGGSSHASAGGGF